MHFHNVFKMNFSTLLSAFLKKILKRFIAFLAYIQRIFIIFLRKNFKSFSSIYTNYQRIFSVIPYEFQCISDKISALQCVSFSLKMFIMFPFSLILLISARFIRNFNQLSKKFTQALRSAKNALKNAFI